MFNNGMVYMNLVHLLLVEVEVEKLCVNVECRWDIARYKPNT